MFDVTIKTLDSQSRIFTVEDEITVQQFKEKIASEVNVPADRQRLIYQGRVLSDSNRLNANGDMNGKVVHLVERMPQPLNPPVTGASAMPQHPPRPAAPRPTVPGSVNISNVMGPFPMPGPGSNFNSNQFVQQMLQQALSGMSSPIGPTVVRGSVRHPNAPGGDNRTEIRIHISPQNGAQQVPRGPRPPVPGPQQGAHLQQGVQQPQPDPPVVSEPRTQLNYVQSLIVKLEEYVSKLESKSYDNEDSESSSTSGLTQNTESGETMDVENQPEANPEPVVTASTVTSGESSTTSANTTGETPAQTQASASATENPNIARHPMLPEVGQTIRRLMALEHRFLPYLAEYTDFLDKDPAFASRESEEYRNTMGFLRTVLRAQRTLGIIHRNLSQIAIPISVTPPRSMLVHARLNTNCPVHRPAPYNRHARNVASAGNYLEQPYYMPSPQQRNMGPYRHPRVHLVRGPSATFFNPGPRMNMPPPRPAPAMFRMPMPPGVFGFGSVNVPGIRVTRPDAPNGAMYMHPLMMTGALQGTFVPGSTQSQGATPGPVPTSGTAPASATALSTANVSTANVATNTTRAPREEPARAAEPVNATSSSAPGSASVASSTTTASTGQAAGPGAHVQFMPPEYTVQVTTNIQPNISINVIPGGAPPVHVVPATVDDGAIGPVAEGVVGAEDGFVNSGETQVDGEGYSFLTTMQSDDDGNIMMPTDENFPNIPGIPPETMREILQSVNSSVHQVMSNINQGGEGSSGGTGASEGGENASQSGRITVERLSGGVNQIPQDIANIIGQTVQNVVLNHLDQNFEQQPQSTPPSNAATAPSPTIPTAPSTTNTTSGAATTTAQPASVNMLAELLNQVSGGRFGTTPQSSARPPATAPAASGSNVTGCSGRRGMRLPAIRKMPNCINEVVRGSGYSEQMMSLQGDESIISLFFFLAGELLTIQEATGVMAGRTAPMNRLREPMRNALIKCWFDGKLPTRDDIETLVDSQSEESRYSLCDLFRGFSPRSSDISIIESNLSLHRYILRRILHLLFFKDAETFGVDTVTHLTDSFAMAVHLNAHILRGSIDAVSQIASRQLEAALNPFTVGGIPGQNNPMVDQVRSLISGRLLPFLRNRPVTQERIDQFVMDVPVEPSEPSTTQEQADDAKQEDTEPMDLDSPSTEASTSTSTTDEKKESKGKGADSSPPEDKSKISADKDDDEEEGGTEEGAAGNSEDWRTLVPEEWVSVISADIEKQKTLPDQPKLSDAYNAGMPASKRRRM